jgi:predicted ATPase
VCIGELLVVLDDLQWADRATVRLLVHLATGVTSARLMVVATYRDTETVGQEAVAFGNPVSATQPAHTR